MITPNPIVVPLTVEEPQAIPLELSSNEDISMQSDAVIRVSTSDYEVLRNKPKINTVEVIGEKTGADYNLLDGEYATYAEIMNYLNS